MQSEPTRVDPVLQLQEASLILLSIFERIDQNASETLAEKVSDILRDPIQRALETAIDSYENQTNTQVTKGEPFEDLPGEPPLLRFNCIAVCAELDCDHEIPVIDVRFLRECRCPVHSSVLKLNWVNGIAD